MHQKNKRQKKDHKKDQLCVRAGQGSYVGEFADCIGFNSNVVLFEFLFDLIDAGRDVFGLYKGQEVLLERLH